MSYDDMVFEIAGVNGVNDYRIPIANRRLVLVGTNGSGKTTICKMIQLFLSGNWYYLAKMSLSSIKLTVQNQGSSETFCFDLDDLKRRFRENRDQLLDQAGLYIDDNTMRAYTSEDDGLYLSYLRSLEKRGNPEERRGRILRFDDELVPYYADPFEHIEDESLDKIAHVRNSVMQRFGLKILYLPTYRRIEAGLESLLREDPRDRRSRRFSSERDMTFENGIIHFGMADVADAISKKMEHLKSFSLEKQIELTQGYLHSVLRREYLDVDEDRLSDLTEERVWAVLRRIESSTLSDIEKHQVASIVLNSDGNSQGDSDSDENRKIILHYFTRLQTFYKELQHEEEQVNEFCYMCNKYLSYNELKYDESSYSCYVESVRGLRGKKDSSGRNINLENLSSGEKQIVGLFSKLILEDVGDLFIIIDEPEISLSMEWQKTILLDILSSRNCGCLIAATHSPFVFQNDLVSSAYSLDEFLIG